MEKRLAAAPYIIRTGKTQLNNKLSGMASKPITIRLFSTTIKLKIIILLFARAFVPSRLTKLVLILRLFIFISAESCLQYNAINIYQQPILNNAIAQGVYKYIKYAKKYFLLLCASCLIFCLDYCRLFFGQIILVLFFLRT